MEHSVEYTALCVCMRYKQRFSKSTQYDFEQFLLQHGYGASLRITGYLSILAIGQLTRHPLSTLEHDNIPRMTLKRFYDTTQQAKLAATNSLVYNTIIRAFDVRVHCSICPANPYAKSMNMI